MVQNVGLLLGVAVIIVVLGGCDDVVVDDKMVLSSVFECY